MAATFHNVNALLRTVVLLGLVLLGGWWTMLLRGKLHASELELEARTEELAQARNGLAERDQQIGQLGDMLEARKEEIRQLEATVAEKERAIQALEVAKRLLRVDHRVARLEVLAQGSTADSPDRVRTTVRFTELDDAGEPLTEPRDLTVEGKMVYVEALVIQFDDTYVEQGDPLRGTSLCLFQRLFGEQQTPREGPTLDTAGQQPPAYGGDTTPAALHRELWQRFWDYANDPELARTLGVRALQGEAPFVEARLGKTYRVELRASGGLTIVAE